jgi:hypothetical protein
MRLYDACTVIRSKNAGPFKLTCDLFFSSTALYIAARDSGALSKRRVAELFHVPEHDVTYVEYLDAADAIKISMVTGIASGDPGCRDVYGSQQAAVLFDVDIPVS